MGPVSEPGMDTDWGEHTKVQGGDAATCVAHGSMPQHRLHWVFVCISVCYILMLTC